MPEAPGWYYARRRDPATPPIEVVRVEGIGTDRVTVRTAGEADSLSCDDFDWFGRVPEPGTADGADPAEGSQLETYLAGTVGALRAKGYVDPLVLSIWSATADGVVVGTYLYPDAADRDSGPALVGRGFNHLTKDWIRAQLGKLDPVD